MFFKKKIALSVDDIENLIGVVFTYRNKFMNIGDVAEGNIYTGRQIMELTASNEDKLRMEFDAVVVGCLLFTLNHDFDVSKELIHSATDKVFLNFDLKKSEEKFCRNRLTSYDSETLEGVSKAFYINMPHDGYQEFWEKEAVRIFTEQLAMLNKALIRFIKDESKAKRSV